MRRTFHTHFAVVLLLCNGLLNSQARHGQTPVDPAATSYGDAQAHDIEAVTTATYIVNSAADEPDTDLSDGVCLAPGGGCTLRAALQQAEALPQSIPVEIIIQVPRIVVEEYPAYAINRSDVILRGPIVPEGCGTELPVHAFGDTGLPGTAIERPIPSTGPGIGLVIWADRVTVSGIEFKGFDRGIEVFGQRVELACLAVHSNQTGIQFGGDESSKMGLGLVVSSAVYHNSSAGIRVYPDYLSPQPYLKVERSCIGTLPDCATAAPNPVGITGTVSQVTESIISGNDVGIDNRRGPSYDAYWPDGDMVVRGCHIGTDWTGTRPVGNGLGVHWERETVPWQPWAYYLAYLAENLISGNETGVVCQYCSLEGNSVGVDKSGMQALPNGNGVSISRGWAGGNLISGNAESGLQLLASSARDNVIGLAADGLTPMGNGGHGIRVEECHWEWDVQSVDICSVTDNTIAHSEKNGIHNKVWSTNFRNGFGLPDMRGNLIFSNGGLGIAVEPDSPNLIIPLIHGIDVAPDSIRIHASVGGNPDQQVTLQWFTNTSPDPSGFGEGEMLVGEIVTRTDSKGSAGVVFALPRSSDVDSLWITSTATWFWKPCSYGSFHATSPFSNAVQLHVKDYPFPVIDPLEIQFGVVPVGGSADRMLTLGNAGAGSISGEAAPSPNFVERGFSILEDGSTFEVESGESAQWTLRFAPTSEGAKLDTLRIFHDAESVESPALVTLYGEAVDWNESGPPQRIAPEDGDPAVPNPVTFRWTPLEATLSYELQIALTDDFSGDILTLETDTTSIAEVVLSPFENYLWRVTAWHSEVSSRSSVGHFTTGRLHLPPIARNDTVSTTLGQSLIIDVLANDHDVNNDTLLVVALPTLPQHGVAFLSKEGLQYWPKSGFVGEDQFEYTIENSVGLRATAAVFVTVVLGDHRPPVAVNDTISTTVGHGLVIDVLANDYDVNNDTLLVVALPTLPQHGVAFLSKEGLQYWPKSGFVGEDQFEYTIENSVGLRATATVYVTVLPGTDAESQEALPQVTRLDAPYPNPATGRITIPIALATAGPVRILLYDALGKRVASAVDETFPAGAFHVNLDLGALPAGLYLCVMEAPQGRFVRRFAVVR